MSNTVSYRDDSVEVGYRRDQLLSYVSALLHKRREKLELVFKMGCGILENYAITAD